MAKWNRNWQYGHSLAREWPRKFNVFDDKYYAIPPSNREIKSQGGYAPLTPTFLSLSAWLIADQGLALMGKHEHPHLLVQLKGWSCKQHKYRDTLWSLKNHIINHLNKHLPPEYPTRLRGVWFIGRNCDHCSWFDLSHRNTDVRQLENVGLVLGFSPVGLVDL